MKIYWKKQKVKTKNFIGFVTEEISAEIHQIELKKKEANIAPLSIPPQAKKFTLTVEDYKQRIGMK